MNAIGGNNQIVAGSTSSTNLITAGIGHNGIALRGTDTVLAGPGSVDVVMADTAGTSLVLLGAGQNNVLNDGGAATVWGAGTDFVLTRYGFSTLFFAGSGASSFQGTGTVVGGSGALTVDANNGVSGARELYGTLVFAGSGATSVHVEGGFGPLYHTVVGNAAGQC